MGQDGGVEVDDTVSDEATTLVPYLLFVFSFETQLTKVSIGDSSAQFVIAFDPVESVLDILTEWRRIDIVEEIQTADDIVIFPERTLRLVGARKSTELANDNVLRSGFERKGEHDALKVLPVINDVLGTDFAFGLE